MNSSAHPSHELYRDVTARIYNSMADTDLIDSILAITPQTEQEMVLQRLSAVNTVVSYNQVDDRIEHVPRPAFELGAFAGFLVVREIYGLELPASQVFASMAPHVAAPSHGLFEWKPDSALITDLVSRPELARAVITETNNSIRMAGKLGLRMIGDEARAIVELWSLTELEPVDFQHGFGFSVMGAKYAHEYIRNSTEAMKNSPAFRNL